MHANTKEAIGLLKNLLSWSDRIGSEERIELGVAIALLKVTEIDLSMPQTFQPDDETIINYHITDDYELDFSTFTHNDGGRLDLPDMYTQDSIEQLLKESL